MGWEVQEEFTREAGLRSSRGIEQCGEGLVKGMAWGTPSHNHRVAGQSSPGFLDLQTADIHGFPGGASGKVPACQRRRCKTLEFDPWVGRSPGEGNGNSLQYSCLDNSQRSLVGYSPCSCKESDMIKSAHTHSCCGARALGHAGFNCCGAQA